MLLIRRCNLLKRQENREIKQLSGSDLRKLGETVSFWIRFPSSRSSLTVSNLIHISDTYRPLSYYLMTSSDLIVFVLSISHHVPSGFQALRRTWCRSYTFLFTIVHIRADLRLSFMHGAICGSNYRGDRTTGCSEKK